MRKYIFRISALIGFVLFSIIIIKIGPEQIWDNIKKITWQSFLILFLLRFLYWTLRTLNWKIVFEQYEKKVSFFHLFCTRLTSHAVNQLTPSAYLGAEASRAMLVDSSKRKSIASVIVDKTIEIMVVLFFTILGIFLAIMRIRLKSNIKVILIVFIIIAGSGFFFLLAKQKKGFFGWIINILGKIKLKFKFIEKNKKKIEETDIYISDFYNKQKKIFLVVFLLYSLMVLFWISEIHLTLVFMGLKDITFMDSFLIITLGTVAFLLPIVPGSLGIYEITYIGIFAILGLGTDVGLTLVLLRRILALAWAGIGLIPLLKRKNNMEPSGVEPPS